MEGRAEEHFWWGPITSAKKANNIISWVSGAFSMVSALFIFGSFFSPRTALGTFIIIIYALPTTLLIITRSRAAAGLLFGLSLLELVGSAAGAAAMPRLLLFTFVPTQMFLSVFSWRGLRATVALRKIRARAQSSTAEIFD